MSKVTEAERDPAGIGVNVGDRYGVTRAVNWHRNLTRHCLGRRHKSRRLPCRPYCSFACFVTQLAYHSGSTLQILMLAPKMPVVDPVSCRMTLKGISGPPAVDRHRAGGGPVARRHQRGPVCRPSAAVPT